MKGLIIDDRREAYERYPNLDHRVQSIINAKRTSEVTNKETDNFQFSFNLYEGQNEDTFLVNILPYLIKTDRTVELQPQLPEESKKEIFDFVRSGLATVINREYRRSFQAFRDDGSVIDKDLIKAMAKEDGATNPKPDRLYATFPFTYKWPYNVRIPADIDEHLQIMEGVYNPFFFIEGKSYEGKEMDARNAASRGGGSLCLTLRSLYEMLGFEEKPGADLRTFVFSATLSPVALNIWVNWAEVREEGKVTLFHMTKVAGWLLDAPNLGAMRRTLHNILDWGVGARAEGLKPVYEKIVEYAEKEAADQKEKSGQKKGKAG